MKFGFLNLLKLLKFSLHSVLFFYSQFYVQSLSDIHDSDKVLVGHIACFYMLHEGKAIKIGNERRTSKIRDSKAIVGYRTDMWSICEKYMLSDNIKYRILLLLNVQNKRRYPPSQIRYQMEHPPVTVHLNKRLKDILEKVKKNRSYAEVIRENLEGTFNIEREIKTLPKSEAMIQYIRGFKEAANKFAVVGECSKCHLTLYLWGDGKCIICHKEGMRPNFSYFNDKESATVLDEEDFNNANVKLPAIEHLSYENGRLRGKEEGWSDGFDDGEKEGHDQAREEFEITYPCSVCGKPMHMKPGSKDHIAMIRYMKEHGWHHGDCEK